MPARKVPFDRILSASAPPVTAARDTAYRIAAEEPYDGALAPEERDAVFEIAAMMATASGPLGRDEARALGDLVTHLQGRAASSAEVAALLEAADRRRGIASAEERLRELLPNLRRRVVRELAYKAAYAIRVSDLEANDDEADLDDLIVEVLDLAGAAGELASQVNEALVGDDAG